MISNTDQYKTKLEEEKKKIEGELATVAEKDPNHPTNWDPALGERENASADENEAADAIEDFEENMAITNSLEGRLKDVVAALEKIESGEYGVCKVCGNDIEADRLEANPAAPTCKTHIESV
ncbi:MAG TPA: TraR/DksA C4-type zinc finger protein [Parcubacteria group bacterium]|nr:TraR/DksA C4-type zinc finger protein [Parcubacteria group bacterium]